MELLCSRELALILGAIAPETNAHHRELKNTCLLVREADTSASLFWPWTMSRLERMVEAMRSS